MEKLFEIATQVSTPLALGGLIAAIVFLIFRQIISKNIFPKLTDVIGGNLLKLIINRLFFLSLVAMALGFIAYITPTFLSEKIKTKTAETTQNQIISQSSRGINSPNIGSVDGDVTFNVKTGESVLDIPSFDDVLEPGPGDHGEYRGQKFNAFMLTHNDKVVHIAIYLDQDMIKEVIDGPDDERIIFTVPNVYKEISYGGNEYLIHLSEGKIKDFEFSPKTGKLSGYFKIWGVNGPHQGFMSVNMRPVKIN